MVGEWFSTSGNVLPKVGTVVDTKIDDEDGLRNEQPLKRGGTNGNLWFFPDGGMYVYYRPTHWKPMEEAHNG